MPTYSRARHFTTQVRRWVHAVSRRVRHRQPPNRTVPNQAPLQVQLVQHPVTRRSAEAIAVLIRAGWNIHHPPYGYTTMTVAGARSRRGTPRTRLTPDPLRAPVVQAIFYWRAVTGLSVEHITARLDADHDRYPPPGTHTSWPPAAIAAILTTIKYTGYQATGTRDENGAFRPVEQWVLSDQPAHRALVTPALFWAAQDPATSVRQVPHRLLAPAPRTTASQPGRRAGT
ncbi:recombinase family protein [Amycolatopsis sp. NPDC051373]|uniref:recombinase family protein n=1 Tax=Amycolatopsis sp. NPDC051373 TaxID=3155801 RepID=UPI00344B5902